MADRHTQPVVVCVDNGSHNVSRWMTWLPISLKNAVKCDKWYQLQNHSITESLNANGAWEKLYCVIPVHAIFLSVEQKTKHTRLLSPQKTPSLSEQERRRGRPRGRVVCVRTPCISVYMCVRTVYKLELDSTRVSSRGCVDLLSGGCIFWVAARTLMCARRHSKKGVKTKNQNEKNPFRVRRFFCAFYTAHARTRKCVCVCAFRKKNHFVYRPECGRTTRRT